MDIRGVKKTLHIISDLNEYFPPDPYEKLHIIMHNLYPSLNFLKGLTTFLGGSAIVILIFFVTFWFYISAYMGCI